MPRDRSRSWFLLLGAVIAIVIVLVWPWGDRGRRGERSPAPRLSDAASAESRPASRAASQALEEAAPAESRPDSRDADQLRLTFVDEEGARVRGRVALFRDQAVIAKGHTDLSDVATFAAITLPASVALVAYNRDPAVQALEQGSGALTIRLPKGAVVGGRVLVNGATPKEKLELRLMQSPPIRVRDSWPPAIEQWIRELNPLPTELRAWTDLRDGAFRFSGLHDEWKGRLYLTGGYRIEGTNAHDVPLSRPESDLVLNLIEPPQIRGRVVTARTRLPNGNGTVGLTTVRADGGVLATGGVFAEASGRFAIPVPEGGVQASGTLRVSNRTQTMSREIALSADDLAHGRDLGDIELEAPASVRIRVLSKEGGPIAGARVLGCVGEFLQFLASSAPDGRAAFEVPAKATVLRIVASGFEPVEIPIPSEQAEVDVTLSRSTRLTIRVVFADGIAEADWVRLWLESDGRILEPSAKSEWRGVRRAPPDYDVMVWDSSEDGTRVELESPPATISCIRAGRPIVVRAHDHLSDAAASQSIVLKEGEWKTVVLTLPVAARMLSGKVTDPAGAAVYQAQVLLESGGRQVAFRQSERDGSFVFRAVPFDRVKASVSVPGFARWSQDVTLTSEGIHLVIQLEPPR